MRTIPLMLVLVVMFPAFIHARGCEMTTTTPEVDTHTDIVGAPRYDVDNDFGQPLGPIISYWVYEESNGIDGLQRADEVIDNTCGGAAGPGDLIVL